MNEKPRAIGFAVSGIKHYENDAYKNNPISFGILSVTGDRCGCRCAHCDGSLLKCMPDGNTIEKFISYIDKAAKAGSRGVLVSGGSDTGGSVPLLPLIEGIAYAKKKGLKVVVHTGLVDLETALALRTANVDQVLLDVIGSKNTISNVYGIDKTPEDFHQSMRYCGEAGLEIVPHIVIGLDFGRIDGEYRAIDMVAKENIQNLVLVVLTPKRETSMTNIPPPPLADVIKVFRYAADTLKDARINLGCARPFLYSADLEKAAVDLGFDAIAYPRPETIRYAEELGMETFFFEECCSLVGSYWNLKTQTV